jgi:hypothetical protein
MPLPLAPAVMVIHAALLVAVHEQLVPLVTLKEPVPPVDGVDALLEPRVKAQGAPDWVTVCVWPPTVMVPVRSELLVFAATI